jgi:folate-binding protein YgfZ
MSDNPQYGTAMPFALDALRVIALTGRDAIAFAQAQFMNDVAALGDGQWQWNGWLDPKGRVQALFALVRIDAETLWLVTTAGDAFDTALARFVFRSKVRIAPLPLHAVGRLATPSQAAGAAIARAGEAVELDLAGGAGARTLTLTPEAAATHADLEARWWHLDIAHGWPALPGVRLSDWTPQQLSLQRLGAFSVKKGCYPGQEIVARTHFLGRAKRGLFRLQVAAARPGDALRDADGREVGTIVACARDEALAVLPLEPADARYRLGDAEIAPLALADGLAR